MRLASVQTMVLMAIAVAGMVNAGGRAPPSSGDSGSQAPPSSSSQPSSSSSRNPSPAPPPSSRDSPSSSDRSSSDRSSSGGGSSSGGRGSPPPPSASAASIAPMSSPSTLPTSCAATTTRYECRELTDVQRNALFDAFKRLMTTGAYDKYVDWHVSVTSTAHGVPEFLPWHREYLRRLEIDLGVPLCYWDWASDAQVPEASPLLMPGWGGTNGQGSCIKDAFWGDWAYKGDCASTQWDGSSGGIGAFYSIDYIAKLIQDSNSYDTFRVAYEGTAHARVHNGLGGMFSKMTSPANPIFFFHHTNVDRHWAIWQWAHPDVKHDYPKSLDTRVAIFDLPVSSLMDTASLCYTYSNMDIISTGRAQVGLLQRRSIQTTDVADLEDRELDRSHHLVKLNRRCGCGNVDAASSYAAPPCDEDRTNLVDLREVRPTPESWIKMEGLNCTEVRMAENDHANFINTLNRIPGYVSPSALYNRPQLLEHVIKNAPKDAKFYVYGPGSTKRHEINMCETYRANPSDAVQKLRKEARKAYPVESYDALKSRLEKVVGCDLAASLIAVGNNRANIPYEPIPEPKGDVCPAGYDFVMDVDESAYSGSQSHSRRSSRKRRRSSSRRRSSRSHGGHHEDL